jgi:hypothetical protein
MMAVALTLIQEGDTERDLYLFDTFDGMSAPTEADRTSDGTFATTHLERDAKGTGIWCFADLNDVRQNMASTDYPTSRVHFEQGLVEQTLPGRLSDARIALLRLDTDWYESTRHEMTHLFPRLIPGGVLIIDDYGHWTGAKKAIDEYFSERNLRVFLHRIDYTGRLLINC